MTSRRALFWGGIASLLAGALLPGYIGWEYNGTDRTAYRPGHRGLVTGAG
jgi:hypothetical protein